MKSMVLAGRPVIDKTGLTGLYDIKLQWSDAGLSPATTTDADRGPSLLTAIEEQLGLKLQSSKGPFAGSCDR